MSGYITCKVLHGAGRLHALCAGQRLQRGLHETFGGARFHFAWGRCREAAPVGTFICDGIGAGWRM